MKRGRGVSPVIATVLLVAMVIIIGLIIFLYLKGFREEAITKFEKNIRLVCEDIRFSASYSGGTLYLSNDGNVPIFGMEVKKFKERGYESQDLRGIITGGSQWPRTGINQGETFSGNIGGFVGDAEKISLIPVLIGKSEKGEKSFLCDDQYGYEINL